MYTSPTFGLTGPSPTTPFNKLGAELQQMLLGIDNTLKNFDYSGADPAAVLSRVAALEVLAARNGRMSGTAQERANAAAAARYGVIWQDTDAGRKTYISNGAGGWRLYAGLASVAAGAWSSSVAPFYGRTAVVSLPTVIAADETIEVSCNNVGTGFGLVVLRNVTSRGATDTQINVGHYQFANNQQMAVSFIWKVVPV
ncbi:hypothetical protein BMH32_04705 [Leucobacter sp. OLJS4]|uniref:hypothetical protein n=1 Tax=unclassified Leucobacter TaxID=2621730 RepID=UPI000C197121|nr:MULTISPECIES: hypothetical protein [unclassified Leucobacter]PII81559.1 hypothetical protein BMH25_13615 [Leucobacter sp. OLCALW19]PII86231.1 hypothetical protein BMH26_14035 [Leucobacter sp. OLTLW20]PII90126.1 hypothetical protein BMH27_12200 [Leucobacter sp. OLAS13]PII97159.1 hypothetical protein BMH29_12885 [Leucobacter sp. OLDS2]PIJ00027.1 hypothetical protein BMH28_09800 [Leucobacter sp. OLCS4]